ncbi:MAG: NfeD family protein [Gammaproteobacteria bacterium]|nr:NfeD family protein [Gammaproteobacteria bacterium]NNJ92536.1 NfeD family protein [Gammaproteobacteria bacterium]
MAEWLQNMDFWHWWVIGIIFVVLEVFSPAAFFLWLGLSAGVVGLFMVLQPEMTWEWQLTLFALFSVISTVAGRRWFASHQKVTDQPALNRRGEQYVGRTFTLKEPIVNGTGKIKVDDTTWKISGMDMAAGDKVRVVGVDGVVLKVEAV